ncbi:MAG: O-antigen ligase family protein, partial [Desulfatirhabdiaceae bacterium]
IERLLFILIILFLVLGLFNGKINFRRNNTIEMMMLLFIMVCILSMIRTGFLPSFPQFPSPWFMFITGYLFPFLIFIYAKNYIQNQGQIELILQTLFFFGLYLSVIAAFEYFNLRQFVFPNYINNPNASTLHLDRARGPFLNAAFNGVGIVIGFVSGVHLLQDKKGFTRFFYQMSLLLFFPAIFFTLTRSCYLGMLIAIIVLLGWYKTSVSKWKLIPLPLVVVLIVGIINSPRLLSTERREGGVYQIQEVDIRLALMQRSVIMFTERPFAGVGLAQFIPASLKEYKGRVAYVAETAGTQFQHNHVLGLAVELGLGGVVVYLIIVSLILRRLKQLYGKLPISGIMGNNLCIVILAVWLVYLNNNLFVEPSNNIFLNAVPFLFAGLADGLYTRSLEMSQSYPSTIRTLRAYV